MDKFKNIQGIMQEVKAKYLRNIGLFIHLCILIPGIVYSQNSEKRYSFTFKNVQLEQVLTEIEAATNYHFIYNNNVIKSVHPLDMVILDKTITELLNLISEKEGLMYYIHDQQIAITTLTDQNMRPGEEIIIRGVITDVADNNTLPGVNISIKGTTKGTISDLHGSYQITAHRNDTLLFSFVGYNSIEMPVNGKMNISVSMSAVSKELAEVVVIGYGSLQKKDFTGSLTSLKSDDFNKGAIVSPEQMMQGRVAGLQITQNSGEPGAGTVMQLRGPSSILTSSTPLYVIDGIPMDNQSITPSSGSTTGGSAGAPSNPMNFINPDDIESIDVLKDASASAIYGSRGANGVIIITTKKGSSKNAYINYSGYFGISKLANKLDVLSADEFVNARVNILGLPVDNKYHYGGNTDWQDEVYRTAYTQNHSFSMGGGKDNSTFHASFNYLDQQGIMLKSDLKRYTGRINVIQKTLNDRLVVDTRISASQMDENRPPIAETTNNIGDVVINALQANPTMPVYDSIGAYFQPSRDEMNPVAEIMLSDDETKTTKILASMEPSLEFFKYFTYKMNIGLDYSTSERWNQKNAILSSVEGTGGTCSERKKEIFNLVFENTLQFKKIFRDIHNFEGLLGYSYTKDLTYSSGFSLQNFSSDILEYRFQTQNAATSDVFSSPGENTLFEMQSFFGRINYTLKDKYLTTFTYRVDGSSKFGENNKYGKFPSLAAAWRLSEEQFVKNLNVFSTLKLRIGWGETGNSEIGGGHSLFSLGPVNSARAVLTGENEVTNGIVLTRTPSPDIKWETTTSTNVGIDYGFFNNRLNGSIDYFNKKTTDMLVEVPSIQPAPTATQLVNVPRGYVLNKGVEIVLTGILIDKKNLHWEINGSFTKIKNIVEDLPVSLIQTGQMSGPGSSGTYVQVITNGYPMNEFYGLIYLGFDSTGNSVYQKGHNGNDTMLFLGSPLPKFSFGLNSTLQVKNWDLSFFIECIYGQKIYNNTRNSMGTMGTLNAGHNTFESVIETNESPTNSNRFSSRFLEDGSYLRLANLTLGYSIPFHPGSFFKNLRIYATGNNLLLFTNYTGYDPDVNTNAPSSQGYRSIGIDNTNYPKSRSYIIGLSATF